MVLSSAQRSFFVKDQFVGPIVINALIGAVLSWLAFRHHTPVTLKGDPGIARDLIGALFILPFVVSLITTRLSKKMALKHGIEPFRFGIEVPSWLRKLPAGRYPRAALIALATLVLLYPPLLGLFVALGVQQMSLSGFVMFKAVLAGLVSGVVAPVSALYALGQQAEEGPQGARAFGKIAPAE